MIFKLLGLAGKKKVLKTPSYMQSWKYPLKKQRDLRAAISKNFKDPKFRAKTKLVPYSKKFI